MKPTNCWRKKGKLKMGREREGRQTGVRLPMADLILMTGVTKVAKCGYGSLTVWWIRAMSGAHYFITDDSTSKSSPTRSTKYKIQCGIQNENCKGMYVNLENIVSFIHKPVGAKKSTPTPITLSDLHSFRLKYTEIQHRVQYPKFLHISHENTVTCI